MRNRILTLAAVIVIIAASLAAKEPARLTSRTGAFQPGGTIPARFTCTGENISPSLTWTAPPAGTRSFVLIVDDPDAPSGTWVHWVAYNLPAVARHLPEHVPPGETIVGGGKQGLNDFPSNGYGGPCPPPGKPHRYFFRLYALDTTLDLSGPVRRQQIDEAMKGHIVAEGALMGTFGR